METVLFYVFDSVDQTGATPVESVQIRIYSEGGDTLVTYGTSDSDGEFSVDVPVETYWVRFFKEGYSFESKQYIEVSATETNIFDVEAENLEILPPSTGTNLCRVSGYVIDAGGQPRSGATFQFMLNPWRLIVGNRAITASKIITRSDEYGYVEVELIQSAIYEAVVEGRDDEVFLVKVPSSQSSNITELIWPYTARVDLSPTSVSVAVDAEEEVSVTVVLSSGLSVPYYDQNNGYIRATSYVTVASSDKDIASVSLDGETLTVTGVSSGSATISFSAIEVWEKRIPAVSVTLDTIAVTVS